MEITSKSYLSLLKAGFVKTQNEQIEYMRQLLRFTGDAPVLDTCCADGATLAQLATPIDENEFNIVTYGVEIDKTRGEQALETLDHVFVASIESMMISNDAFSYCFLNPPYDQTLANNLGQTERKEWLELQRVIRYLAPGGVLMYVIPHYRFAHPKIAHALATYFSDIQVARFTDENYGEYKQVVFIGRKKRSAYKELDESLFKAFTSLEDEQFVLDMLPTLASLVKRQIVWEVPEMNTNVKTFYSRLINKSEVANAIRESKGFQHFKEHSKPRQLVINGNPALPPSAQQIALLLSSGGLNGIIGEDERLHCIKGMEVVTNITKEEKSEHSTVTKITTKRGIFLKAITPSGIVKKFS